jgi:dipeptidase E
MQKLLLLSNSTMPGTAFFSWPKPWVKDFLGDKPKNLIFIPFAAVNFPFDEYEEKVRLVFNDLNHSIFSIHNISNKKKAIEDAEAIVIGGGNTFALLSRIYENNLLRLIRAKVVGGTPYIGWSAGANLACPTLMTTNDMPIVQPPSFESLRLIPFQINPHYHELKFETQGGETRIERLNEFIGMNPEKIVLGLPEGMLLKQESGQLLVKGTGMARLYMANQSIKDIPSGTDISYLLTS